MSINNYHNYQVSFIYKITNKIFFWRKSYFIELFRLLHRLLTSIWRWVQVTHRITLKVFTSAYACTKISIYFNVRTYFLYFTCSLFKISHIILSILYYILLKYYSLRPIFFVLFEKSNFLREHHLLSCLPFKNV